MTGPVEGAQSLPDGQRRPGGSLHFGTGARITWGSVAADEWQETELKARRLLAVARGGQPVS